MPESVGIPPAVTSALSNLIEMTRGVQVSTLAAAVISASGRPYSVAEALEVHRDVYFAMNPSPQHGTYQEWAKTKDDRLAKVRT